MFVGAAEIYDEIATLCDNNIRTVKLYSILNRLLL